MKLFISYMVLEYFLFASLEEAMLIFCDLHFYLFF